MFALPYSLVRFANVVQTNGEPNRINHFQPFRVCTPFCKPHQMQTRPAVEAPGRAGGPVLMLP